MITFRRKLVEVGVLMMVAVAGAGMLLGSTAGRVEAAPAFKCTHTRCETPSICVYDPLMYCTFLGPNTCMMNWCDID